jgi:hypothetical protein
MRSFLTLPILVSILLVGLALALGAPFDSDPTFSGVLAMAALAAPEVDALRAQIAAMPWRRVRKDLTDVTNVAATGVATIVIPRYALSLLGVQLKMGGTTFDESKITDIRVKLGSKVIWGPVTGADLRAMNAAKGYYDGNRQFLHLDFCAIKSKNIGGEMMGGIDMSKLPAGKCTILVTITGATAPTLDAKGHWGPPQGNATMQRLLQFTWGSSSSGRRVTGLDFDKTRIRNLFILYSGTDWANTATSAAWTANTGNGVMGAVTVAAAAQVGVHKFVCTQANANLGTFQHQTPDGKIVSSRMIVASAYSGGGLAFTLADGATDFIPGDGFDITVSENTNGNITRVEVIKNGESVWDFTDAEARQIQKQHGYVPQTKMAMVNFEVDNWPDGILPTADATTLDVAATLTASDTAITIYAEVLDTITGAPSDAGS